MTYKIDESFAKDLLKIKDEKLLSIVADKIVSVSKAKALSEITNCKKMRNSKIAYRIRIGDYRIGFEFIDNTVIYLRFLHRSKIYLSFP